MTYSSGGLIQAADYNGFVGPTSSGGTANANINDIWGTGSGDKGWGQPELNNPSNTGASGTISSVTLATGGELTVTSGSYAVGQQIIVTGTFSAGSISGYTSGTSYYIIAVSSSTSITISATPSGAAVTSTAGTATPGATFTVVGSSLVTATQWATLVNTLSTIGSQTNTTITARSAPTTGSTISILSAVNTDLTNVTTNRANAAAVGSQYTSWTGTNSQTSDKAAGTWTITITNTVTFASSNAARYFFNGGGIIKLVLSKTSTGQTGDPAWNDLANNQCGTIYFSGVATSHTVAGVAYTGTTKIGGTGTPTTLATTTGFYALTPGGAATVIYKQFSATAPYTSDYIQHTVALDAGSSVLTFVTTWVGVDGDPITGGTAASGATPGTAPCTICLYTPPSTTYLTTASWGTPTVAATTA